MKPYILVSLWAADDEATTQSHEFAKKLAENRTPSCFLDGDSVSHEELRRAAAKDAAAAVVLFGHGGAGISARSKSAPWIRPEQLADVLSGRRVYAFACSTFEPNPELLLSTFASRTVDACISVFVGHAAPVMAPLVQAGVMQSEEEALLQMIEAFIDGEDEHEHLRALGRRSTHWQPIIEIDLTVGEAASGWSSATHLHTFFRSLSTEKKPPLAAA